MNLISVKSLNGLNDLEELKDKESEGCSIGIWCSMLTLLKVGYISSAQDTIVTCENL